MNKKRILLLGGALYVLIFFMFYPSFFTFSDESAYLHQAKLLSEGKSQRVVDDLDSQIFDRVEGGYISQYPIGVPLLVTPLALLSWQSVFLLNLMLHLLGFFLFGRIIKKLGYNELYSFLYLLFPGFVFFSRTIMSEIPSMVAVLAGFYFYMGSRKRDNVLAGVCFGAACLFRYTNLLVFIAFGAVTLFKALKDKKEFRKLLLMGAGFAPFAVFILWYNSVIYGGMFSTGMKSPRATLAIFFSILGKFLGTMLLVYPLMAIAPFVNKKYKWEILLAFLFYIVLFSFGGVDTFHYDLARNLVIGDRYLFPMIPLLLVAYVPLFVLVLGWLSKRLKMNYGYLSAAVVVLLFVGAMGVSYQQHSFTSHSRSLMDTIYANTDDGSLIISDGYVMSFVNDFFGDRNGIKVKTYSAPSEPFKKEFNDENRNINTVLTHYKDHKTYMIFFNQQYISDFTAGSDLEAKFKGEEELLNRFDHELVYAQEKPYLVIYEIV